MIFGMDRGRGSRPQAASGMPRRLLPLVKVRLFIKPPYVAGPHPRTRKHVPRHFRDGFGEFPFLHGNPLSNQFDGSMLVGFVRKKIPYETRFSLGIESCDPNIPTRWHTCDLCPALSGRQDTLRYNCFRNRG